MSPPANTADLRCDDLATLVLAAGAGTRFGGGKQLTLVEGQPLLSRVLGELREVAGRRIVVLGAEACRVTKLVPRPEWEEVRAEDWVDGPGATLRAGLAAAPDAEAALIILGDLAWLRREAVERVIAAARDSTLDAVRAFEGEVPGHPLLLRGRLLDLARGAPDEGMGPLLATTPVEPVQCRGLGVARDVDTAADLGPE